MATVSDAKIGVVDDGTGHTLFAQWTCYQSNIDHFETLWHWYDDNININQFGYEGANNTNIQPYDYAQGHIYEDRYTAPDCYGVRVWIRPVSKTHTVNGEEVSYWQGYWTYAYSDAGPYWLFSWSDIPEAPSTPTLEIDPEANSSGKYKLIATLNDYRDSQANYVNFYFRKYESGTGASSSPCISTVYVEKTNQYRATAYVYVSPGASYAVAARGVRSSSNNRGGASTQTVNGINGTITIINPLIGEWSPYSNEVSPPPDKPTNPACNAYNETSVKVTWTKASGADGYEIQYSSTKDYLESGTGDVQSTTISDNTDNAYITGLDSGNEWFFRIRATNDTGESGWTDIVSTVIGTAPESPTTWSSTTVAMLGEKVMLYWVHNCEDGSDQSAAEIQINTSSIKYETIEVDGDEREYELDASDYEDGMELTWKVRTKGVLDEFGEWSTTRTIKIYAPATLSLDMPEELTSFPYTIIAEAGPSSQRAISYYISVTSMEYYEVTGPTGETLYISPGDEVYSKLYNTNLHTTSQVLITLSVEDLTLKSGITYKVTVTVAMDSGLTAENSLDFIVNWDDELYTPDASVGIDFDNFTAYVMPRCEEFIGYEDDDDPDSIIKELVQDVTLAVYRREFDGTFTLIGDGIINDGSGGVTDPHPGLDYARYRIVAKNTNTGQISYEDIPGVPVNQPYIVMQWDEDWNDFYYNDAPRIETVPNWSGSMVKIRSNVDISESHDKDVSRIEYVGRSHPVSYFGTQEGESGVWNVEIDKSDKETIYALRRLAQYMGNVYVREPSGIGYWANIEVSMNENHCEMIVPVSFTITRVEGDA